MAVVFSSMASLRFVDGDEGYYLLASRLILDGKWPYKDFFYTQMPLLPYVYGIWMKATGVSFYSGRALSALLSIVLGLMLCYQAKELTHRRSMAILALLLYSFSALAVEWFPVVKTYALSTTLLFAAYSAVPDSDSNHKHLRHFIAGMLLGLAFATRSVLLAAAPAFLVHVFLTTNSRRDWMTGLLSLCSGFCVSVAACGILLVADAQGFLFGNLGYHAARIDFSPSIWIGQKLDQLAGLFLLRSARQGLDNQFPILLFLNLLSARLYFTGGSRFKLSLSLVLCLFVGTMVIPTDSVQYFVVLMPFLILNSLYVVNAVMASLTTDQQQIQKDIYRWGLVILLFAYFAAWPIKVYDFTVSGYCVPGIKHEKDAYDWKIDTIDLVAQQIDRLALPHEQVLTWWPGYLVDSKATVVPGLENHFGREAANLVSQAEAARYHMLPDSQADELIDQAKVRIIVLGNWAPNNKDELRKRLTQNRYANVARIGDTEIYLRDQPRQH